MNGSPKPPSKWLYMAAGVATFMLVYLLVMGALIALFGKLTGISALIGIILSCYVGWKLADYWLNAYVKRFEIWMEDMQKYQLEQVMQAGVDPELIDKARKLMEDINKNGVEPLRGYVDQDKEDKK